MISPQDVISVHGGGGGLLAGQSSTSVGGGLERRSPSTEFNVFCRGRSRYGWRGALQGMWRERWWRRWTTGASQTDFWAAGGDDCLLEVADTKVHLLEEHTGIPEVQAVPEVPVDEEMFLGRFMAVGRTE